jgi:hypothetical protein
VEHLGLTFSLKLRGRHYIKGTAGNKINTLLAASAFNMLKWMRMKRNEFLFFFFGGYISIRFLPR